MALCASFTIGTAYMCDISDLALPQSMVVFMSLNLPHDALAHAIVLPSGPLPCCGYHQSHSTTVGPFALLWVSSEPGQLISGRRNKKAIAAQPSQGPALVKGGGGGKGGPTTPDIRQHMVGKHQPESCKYLY